MYFLAEYFNLNIILVLASCVGFLISFGVQKINKMSSARQNLNLHYMLLVFAVFVFIFMRFLPEESFEKPLPQQFSSTVVNVKTSLLSIAALPVENSFKEFHFPFSTLFLLFLSLFIVFKLGVLVRGVYTTLKNIKTGFLYKKIGSLSLYISEDCLVPYAFSFLDKSYVSVPAHLIETPKYLHIAVKHELQHIRNKDTFFSYMGEFCKAVFFINPFILKWVESIKLKQEFSCDEELLLNRGVSARDYKSCLFEVANKLENSLFTNPVGAAGFLLGDSRSDLIRRINEMSTKKYKLGRMPLTLILLASLSITSFSAYALKVHSGFGKLSVGEVKSFVRVKDFSDEFPIEVNKRVVAQLNKLVRTRKGKVHTRTALKNYKKYKNLIQGSISKYGHPEELAAVGFVESAFSNPGPNLKTRHKAAGMWQFIYPTAEAFGLVVDGEDRRTDIPEATGAAMNYLGRLNLVFQDWRLAMLSYNAGEHAVQSMIMKTGTRDPWKITKSGLRYDKGYLAKVMAAAIVMKYPEVIN